MAEIARRTCNDKLALWRSCVDSHPHEVPPQLFAVQPKYPAAKNELIRKKFRKLQMIKKIMWSREAPLFQVAPCYLPLSSIPSPALRPITIKKLKNNRTECFAEPHNTFKIQAKTDFLVQFEQGARNRSTINKTSKMRSTVKKSTVNSRNPDVEANYIYQLHEKRKRQPLTIP